MNEDGQYVAPESLTSVEVSDNLADLADITKSTHAHVHLLIEDADDDITSA